VGITKNVEENLTSKTWKNIESKVAKMFEATRTPLSGGSSKHTRADVIHEVLFIEVKHGVAYEWILGTFLEVEELAKREGKKPLLVLHPKGTSKYLGLAELKDFGIIGKEMENNNNGQSG